ncbi:MAG: CpsD/CapB family tyrosine-protein kinase [Flexilinea sp.]|nr:CpsD/CapB family tyrosine-protein kinase [Flexilinea sp.]
MDKKEYRNRGFIAVNNPSAPWNYTEAYKSLRTNLSFVSLDKEYKKILVTSSIPKEGKTGFSINLATSLAEDGKKVLLIDCDLRKPMLYKYLQIPRGKGLTNLLTGNESGNIVQHMPALGIDFLDAGVTPPNPVELLGSSAMKDIVAGFESYYDYLIFDTPPVGIVTDAAVLSMITDGVIFVIRQKFAALDQIRLAKANLEAVKAHIIGSVLNDYDVSGTTKKGGYYYNYAYDYKYKS